MTDTEAAVTPQELRWKATNTPVDTHTAYALSVALEEGEITGEEAAEALEFREEASGLEWITSDHYPGDECYDKADLLFGGLYE